MADNIPITVKPASQAKEQDIKNALNLNRVLAEAREPKARKKSKIWLLVLFLLLIILGLTGWLWWLSRQSFSDYQSIIPEQAEAIILLKTSQLADQAPQISSRLEKDSSLLRWLEDKISQFLADSGLSAPKDILPLFRDEIAFFVLPPTQNQKIAWLALSRTVSGQETQKQAVIGKIENGLRKNFGTDQTFYRQIKINSAYSFNQAQTLYYWAQINDFIAVSNDLASMQLMIDKIIGN